MAKRKPQMSTVVVEFVDGEVREYVITAGVTIGSYLAQEAGRTGILCLFNDTESHAIPVAGNIRQWCILGDGVEGPINVY